MQKNIDKLAVIDKKSISIELQSFKCNKIERVIRITRGKISPIWEYGVVTQNRTTKKWFWYCLCHIQCISLNCTR